MKRSLSTVSVYQRERLKLSSRCLHFSTRGMFQQGRFVIQMGGMRRNYEGEKKKNQPVFPRCAINIAHPEDVVVGSMLVYIFQRKRWRN